MLANKFAMQSVFTIYFPVYNLKFCPLRFSFSCAWFMPLWKILNAEFARNSPWNRVHLKRQFARANTAILAWTGVLRRTIRLFTVQSTLGKLQPSLFSHLDVGPTINMKRKSWRERWSISFCDRKSLEIYHRIVSKLGTLLFGSFCRSWERVFFGSRWAVWCIQDARLLDRWYDHLMLRGREESLTVKPKRQPRCRIQHQVGERVFNVSCARELMFCLHVTHCTLTTNVTSCFGCPCESAKYRWQLKKRKSNFDHRNI